jgi:hypothetical protein
MEKRLKTINELRKMDMLERRLYVNKFSKMVTNCDDNKGKRSVVYLYRNLYYIGFQMERGETISSIETKEEPLIKGLEHNKFIPLYWLFD